MNSNGLAFWKPNFAMSTSNSDPRFKNLWQNWLTTPVPGIVTTTSIFIFIAAKITFPSNNSGTAWKGYRQVPCPMIMGINLFLHELKIWDNEDTWRALATSLKFFWTMIRRETLGNQVRFKGLVDYVWLSRETRNHLWQIPAFNSYLAQFGKIY